MSEVWVRVKKLIEVSDNGVKRQLPPGEWWPMSRQGARQCLIRDEIEILKKEVLQSVQQLHDCRVLAKGELPDGLEKQYPGVPVETFEGFPDEHGRFLIWDTEANLRNDLILVGFALLERWQMAVPLLDYDILAESVGTKEERARAKKIIHDLRVPVYDCRVMFIRQSQEARRLFASWDGSQLGFLTALYQARPIINALPPTWILKA